MLIFWRQPSLKDFGSHMINNIQSKLVTMCYIDVTLGIKASLGSHGCLVMMVGQLKIYVTYVKNNYGIIEYSTALFKYGVYQYEIKNF